MGNLPKPADLAALETKLRELTASLASAKNEDQAQKISAEIATLQEKLDGYVYELSKPGDWLPAAEIQSTVDVQQLNGTARFKVCAMSYQHYQDAFKETPTPEVPVLKAGGREEANPQDKHYQEARAEAEFKRMVRFIDSCSIKIPGDNLAEKAKWASENLWRDQEVQSLYGGIANLSGFVSGFKERVAPVVTEITDPAQWATLTRSSSMFCFQRAGITIGFRVKPVSRLLQERIEAETEPPLPPKIPKVSSPRNKPEFVDNPDDPKHVAKCGELARRRLVAFLEASLPFQIPGADYEAKHAWIAQRPAGEVLKLYNHVMLEVNGYRSRVSFF